jgi:hypothetical protein
MDGIRLTIIPRKDQPIKKIKLTREECEEINTYAHYSKKFNLESSAVFSTVH